MRILQVFFYTALSVFLMSAGIPNEVLYFGMPLAGLVSLIPFYIALSRCRSFREAGIITSCQFGFVHLISSFWLANFKEYAMLTLGATTLVYFFAGFIIGMLLYIPFSFGKRFSSSLRERTDPEQSGSAFRVLYFACVWTLHEWAKSTGFLAYPWGTLILTAWKWKLVTQIVSLTGTWGISFLFSLFAATVSEVLPVLTDRERRQQLFRKQHLTPLAGTVLFTVSLSVCTLLYGTFEVCRTRIPEKSFNAVLVQHNADSWDDSEEYCISVAEELTTQAIEKSSDEPDLVVWSEGILTYMLPDSWWYYELIPEPVSLQDFISETHVPFIIGAPFIMNEEGMEAGNCAVYLDENGNITDHYAKIHLVPFAEGIPFDDKVWMQKLMQAVAGFSRGWQAGNEYRLFTVQGTSPISISAPVCFEDAFPSVCRKLFLEGSEAFVNITNDSWSLKKSSEYQHYVISSYRALEYRTTLVRSTNGGYTTVTGPTGKILADLPLFEPASLMVEVPVYERVITPYALLGDWVPLGAAVLLLLYFLSFLYYKHFLHSEEKQETEEI